MNYQQAILNVNLLTRKVATRRISLLKLQPSIRTFSNQVIYSRTIFSSCSNPFFNQNFRTDTPPTSLCCLPVTFSTKFQELLYKNHKRTFKTTTLRSLPKEVVSFNLSDIGEGIGEVNIKEWFVEVGSNVKQFDPICEVQSDKASVTITSRFDGKIKTLYYEIDEIAKVGLPLVDIEVESLKEDQIVDEVYDESSNKSKSSVTESEKFPTNLDSYKKTLATPSVRRLAQEYNVKLSNIQGSGKDGRVLKEDILSYIDSISKTNPSGSTSKQNSQTSIQHSENSKISKIIMKGEEKCEVISGIRKVMYKTMTLSNNIPQFQLSDEIDLTNFVAMKTFLKDVSTAKGVPIKLLPFFIKSASISLKQFQILNSSVDNDIITYKDQHNIGFAMDTPSGLVVPNIKSVQNLSIVEIAQELHRLQESGSKGQFSPNDLKDGTFTISNIGSIGGTFGIPLILPPEVAIGALGKIRLEPKFDKTESIVPRHIMTVVWSADHRIIDGATLTRFNNLWKSYLEKPESLLIELK